MLWNWIERLNSFGPRLTGYPAHEASIDLIAQELQAMGLVVQSDVHAMTRWTVRETGLVVAGSPVPVASAFAYSGRTEPQGITAPLVWLGEKPRSLEAAAGKIAVVPVKNAAIGFLVRDLMFTRKAFYPSREEADFTGTVTTPLLSGLTPGIDLAAARRAGVLGVICVFQDMSEEAARDQYNPFITPYQDCPALWVGPAAGARLKAACEAGEQATLTLQAELAPDVPTRTLFAVLEGTVPNETIIVNTHTDGPNACEENGPAALLALARYMSRVPAEQRRRTIIFAFVTGHFQMPQLSGHEGQATSRWLRDHPELWDGKPGHRKAVAGLTIEHIGCREWKDVADRSRSAPTGKLERELVYTTNEVMDQVFAEAAAGRTKIRALTVEPRNGVHLGEGQPLFAAGIPAIAMCPLPDYLCSARRGGDLDRLDPEFAHQQVQTFARALLQLDALPAKVLGSPRPARNTLLGRVVKLGQ
ncbi:hypothetical protein [Caulobacter mirabilis]|uniref:Peptidase M28 domain-containing protein n=1 Tax=Caulobacter mirabilis TaxID=69666 RepID=A0A2D2AZC0_9CAUL|nr:hypothetical protein [Caulobacter mirabilis]ATQ43360.1 hypothetical protein CSW64_13510 [Caulobacter mirabilis]